MLKIKNFNILYLFFIIGCLQSKNSDKALINVAEKPLLKARIAKSELEVQIFEAIKNLDEVDFIRLMRINEAELDSYSLNKDGDTMLAAACRLGFVEAVEYLLSILKFKKTINEKNADGCTPLILASRLMPYKDQKYDFSSAKRFDLIAMLLSHGSDVHLRDNLGHTAPWYAAYIHSLSDEVLKDKRGHTAKGYAAEVLELLKEKGATAEDVYEKKIEKLFGLFPIEIGAMPLNVDEMLKSAVDSVDTDKVFILLNIFGANPNLMDEENGNTVMHLACIKFINDKFNFTGLLSIIKMLYRKRRIDDRLIWGDVERENFKKETPIGIYFSHLIHLASERQIIAVQPHVNEEMGDFFYTTHQTKNLAAINTFLRILNFEKSVYLNIKIKCIAKELSDGSEAGAVAASAAAAVEPRPFDEMKDLLLWTSRQFACMECSKSNLYRFFNRILDDRNGSHTLNISCERCENIENIGNIRKMKVVDILIEMAY